MYIHITYKINMKTKRTASKGSNTDKKYTDKLLPLTQGHSSWLLYNSCNNSDDVSAIEIGTKYTCLVSNLAPVQIPEQQTQSYTKSA